MCLISQLMDRRHERSCLAGSHHISEPGLLFPIQQILFPHRYHLYCCLRRIEKCILQGKAATDEVVFEASHPFKQTDITVALTIPSTPSSISNLYKPIGNVQMPSEDRLAAFRDLIVGGRSGKVVVPETTSEVTLLVVCARCYSSFKHSHSTYNKILFVIDRKTSLSRQKILFDA